MNPEELGRFLTKYGNILKREIQSQLNKNTPYAPGYNLNAYSNGRNNAFSGNAPKSAFGSGNLSNSVEVVYDPQTQYLKGKGSGQSVLIPILQAWARSKGLDPNAAFAIRRNIFKFGIAPTNFYGQALDKVADLIGVEFGNDMDNYIDTLFDNIID